MGAGSWVAFQQQPEVGPGLPEAGLWLKLSQEPCRPPSWGWGVTALILEGSSGQLTPASTMALGQRWACRVTFPAQSRAGPAVPAALPVRAASGLPGGRLGASGSA